MVVGEIVNVTQVLISGGGPGGYHAAARAASHGLEVTLVEADALGGVCLNRGCIPSKALIAGASDMTTPYRTAAVVDFTALQTWKNSVVDRLGKGVKQILKKADVSVVQGHATFVGPDRVSIATAHGAEVYRFEHCIVATGSRPSVIPGFEPDGDLILDSTGALDLATVPSTLAVLGGGYIGLELGTAYAKLGAQVTMVEAMERILPTVEDDLTRVVERRLKTLGVNLQTSTTATGWTKVDGRATLTLKRGETESTLEVDKILVAVGRRPNSDHLDLQVAGVTTDERGFIAVDNHCRSSASHIYAIGDVVGNPMLAHKATRQAEIAADTIAGLTAATYAVAIPAVVFSDPEVAYVGLTEQAAKDAGYDPAIGKAAFAASGRAVLRTETDGFIRVVSDAQTGLLLGVQIVGPEASELIAAATLALEMGARVYDIAQTIHPHPSLAESFKEAAALAVRAV